MKSYINTNSSVTTLIANHLVRYLYRKSRLKVCTLANYRSYSTTKSDSQSLDLLPVPSRGLVFSIDLGQLEKTILTINNQEASAFFSSGRLYAAGTCFAGQKVKRYSTSSVIEKDNTNLNPDFVTGLLDAEASFSISVHQKSKLKKGNWVVQAAFQIRMHYKYSDLLVLVQQFFKGVGFFTTDVKANTVNYSVTKLSDLINIIIPHFENYPLQSAKKLDFELWTQCIEIMANKEHLTESGLNKIVSMKSILNKGLNENLKVHFTEVTVQIKKPLVESPSNLSPHWVAGFVTGEGCFLINIYKAKTKLGFAVALVFQVTQHNRDIELMKSLISFFDCGRYALRSSKKHGDFLVSTFNDINDKIIPFFQKYEILGIKGNDFTDFCKAAEIIKAKGYLTTEGFNNLKTLKEGMNTKRLW